MTKDQKILAGEVALGAILGITAAKGLYPVIRDGLGYSEQYLASIEMDARYELEEDISPDDFEDEEM